MTIETLFSGGARGSEALFGELAEKHALEEVTFTFDGHQRARERGQRTLTDAELKTGDVSLIYVSKLMNRKYPSTTVFKKVLQSIWHQVMSGDEVFVVGWILPDGTVKGGTGWGAEQAKLCNKPLRVFDQERDAWFRWVGADWEPVAPPSIQAPRFTGTGTRFLEENGRRAIVELFERSFVG